MDLALIQARAAAALGEVPIGAVLIEDDEVLAAGFNRPIAANDPTAHAEVAVLRDAARRKSNYRLPGTTLVATLEPCVMCAGALVNARVSRLIYGAKEPKWGGIESLLRLDSLGLNHKIEVVSGVREAECQELLRAFFKNRRG